MHRPLPTKAKQSETENEDPVTRTPPYPPSHPGAPSVRMGKGANIPDYHSHTLIIGEINLVFHIDLPLNIYFVDDGKV
jgi:hypothetical protein